jgi:hypothetical protein
MKRSGDRKNKLTAETRSRGEKQKSTREARRHGEGSDDRVVARDLVIGEAACLCHPERAGADAGARNTRVFRVVGWSHATVSRRTPAMSVPKHAASGSPYETTNLTAETRSRGENTRNSESSYCLSDHPITCDHPRTRSARRSNEILKDLLPRLTTALQTVLAAISEIFDESAYERFLLRTNAGRSIASYRAFSRERDVSMQKKPRCC